MRKGLVIVGNWKANNINAEEWFKVFAGREVVGNAEIIIAAPFTLLQPAQQLIATLHLPVKLCAQDISAFPSGAYTGEITAEMLTGLVDYVLIAHSERRTHLGETDARLAQKVQQAKTHHLKPIYCIQNEFTTIPPEVEVIAYEPPAAIGSGQPDTPENANRVGQLIKKTNPKYTFLYGGSLKPANVYSFVQQPTIDGVLVGGASLEVNEFYDLINNATRGS